jgi:hypothetical protein
MYIYTHTTFFVSILHFIIYDWNFKLHQWSHVGQLHFIQYIDMSTSVGRYLILCLNAATAFILFVNVAKFAQWWLAGTVANEWGFKIHTRRALIKCCSFVIRRVGTWSKQAKTSVDPRLRVCSPTPSEHHSCSKRGASVRQLSYKTAWVDSSNLPSPPSYHMH